MNSVIGKDSMDLAALDTSPHQTNYKDVPKAIIANKNFSDKII